MTNASIDIAGPTIAQGARTRSPWIGTAAWLSLTLLLCMTNILTLLDQDFRHDAYDIVSRLAATPVLRTIGLSKVAGIIEDRSPAKLEKKAVERATVRLVETSTMLLREVGSLKSERATLAAERKTLQRQLYDSRAVLAQYRERAARLGVKVLGRAGRSVTRHLLALPGHALPVLGATVAVGSATIDINDACDSLKELDELNQAIGLPSANRSRICGVVVPTAEELLADARSNWRRVYDRSATALNAGVAVIPRTPPAMSFGAVREWVSSTFNR